MLNNDYAKDEYWEDCNAVCLAWKQFSSGENYRTPTTYSLELLKEHADSDFIIDARNGFEDDKEDVEWGFSFLIPNMSKTTCKHCIMIMNKANDIQEEMDMWTNEFLKYFTVTHVATTEEALTALENLRKAK